MVNIETRHETERGCGYRKPGGLYIVSGGEAVTVDCLPIPLHVCPTCNQGVKPTRSFQWIEPKVLLSETLKCDRCHMYRCPIKEALQGTQGLMWIGSKFYTPQSFMQEAKQVGISKRIPAVPKDFKLGKHWIYLGHREAITTGKAAATFDLNANTPGIFTIFKPTAIEYVVRPDDQQLRPEALGAKAKRGITLVDVVPVEKQEALFGGAAAAGKGGNPIQMEKSQFDFIKNSKNRGFLGRG